MRGSAAGLGAVPRAESDGTLVDLLDDGIGAMKIWPFDPFSERSQGQHISIAEVEAGLRPIKQIRAAVGDRMEIGIEFHCLLEIVHSIFVVSISEGANALIEVIARLQFGTAGKRKGQDCDGGQHQFCAEREPDRVKP